MLLQVIFWNRIFANIERYAMHIIIEGKYNHNHDENNNNTLSTTYSPGINNYSLPVELSALNIYIYIHAPSKDAYTYLARGIKKSICHRYF